jgi:two-component system, LytTR family, sensor kinase
VDDDPRAADRMLTRLGDLLRLVLEGGGRQAVPLVQELLVLDPYLKIQQARFRERLSVRRDIPADAADAEVPNLVLQALVDHAVRHGAAREAGVSRIEIRARRRNGSLELVVEDRGGLDRAPPSVASADRETESAGPAAAVASDLDLADTRTRLHQLYGSAHRFELGSSPGGGIRIDLEIPYRQAPSERPAGRGVRSFSHRHRTDRKRDTPDLA